MSRLKLDSKSRALALVAHPDDETIWMGGTILANPRVRWTIFSLCRADDNDRAPKFRRACKFFGARAVISDLDDEGVLGFRESLPEIRERILKFMITFQDRRLSDSSDRTPPALSARKLASARPSFSRLRELSQSKQEFLSTSSPKFDFVFTHGYNGEYGHSRHRGVHRVVKEMVRRGEIRTRHLFNFSYEFNERKNICRPKEADVFLKLSSALFQKKQKVINEIYGFRKSTFEYRTLANEEHFRILKN